MKKYLLIPALLLSSCTYPQTSVSTGEKAPTLHITGASPTAELFVDRQDAGPAQLFGDGGHALSVPHGTHHIDVRDGGALLYSGDVYLGTDTTKTIALTSRIQ